MTERYVFDPSIYHFTDTKTHKTYCEYNLDEVVDLLNQYEKNEDALIKQLDNLHRKISELAVGLENKSKEHRENDFKLHTLEKYYTCPNCTFSSKEFKYLRSLREKE